VIAAFIIIFAVIALSVASLWIAVRDRKRTGKAAGSINWGLCLCGVVGMIIVDLLLMVYSAYAIFLFLFFVLPAICILCVLWLLVAFLRKRRSHSVQLFGTAFASVALSFVVFLFLGGNVIRPALRWLLWSRQFKAELLAQPAPSNGELRHMEWEATGWAGVANVTVYIAFDPSDALSNAILPGKVAGIPCTVLRAFRLEPRWYSVWFYTDETWSECPWSSKAAAELKNN
jgi:hypothetical protein